MKMFKSIFFSVLFLSAQICAMDLSLIPNPSSEQVEVFFLPQDTSIVRSRLDNLFDNAKKRVLLAMYWITDQKIINKLIALKKKGVDVQIILDESMDNLNYLYTVQNQFLNNDIVSLVFPSQDIGRMHNKFIVIDNDKVWTGSANFTKKALEPSTKFKNHENVTIFYSKTMASKFENNFADLKKEIFNLYPVIIADIWANKLPEWLTKLAPILYKKDNGFKLAVESYAKNANPTQQNRLKKLFPDLTVPEKVKPVSFSQAKELREAGYKQYQIDKMSYDKAYKLIGEIRDQKRKSIRREKERQYKQRYSPYSQSKQFVKRPTNYQRNILRNAGYSDYQINKMSYDEAYQKIGEIMSSSESSQEFSFSY